MTLPLTILGGYLGAGKTTLINHLLRNTSGQKLGVLVNEFGALPIDSDLIEADDGDIVSLTGGCACCSFGDDLAGAIRKLSTLETRLDHLLLEASGVALPSAIGSAVSLISEISLQGIIVLVDAETLPVVLENEYLSDTVRRQLNAADIVVINKSDLVCHDQLESVQILIHQHAPLASKFSTREARVPPSMILANHPIREFECSVDHLPRLISQKLDMASPVNPTNVARELASIGIVVRAKGHMLSAHDDKMWTLQLVGKRFRLTRSEQDVVPGVVVLRLPN